MQNSTDKYEKMLLLPNCIIALGKRSILYYNYYFNHCHLNPLCHTAIAKIIAQAYLNISDT